MSQALAILQQLKAGRTVTPLDALSLCGCFRLSARIFDLKEMGWPIECERRDVGGGTMVGHYTLVNDKDLWPE